MERGEEEWKHKADWQGEQAERQLDMEDFGKVQRLCRF